MSEHRHAVEDGVIRHVSPSQIQTFDADTYGGCPRKWHFDKVQHFPRKLIKALDVGTAVHAELEHYLATGIDALGPIARAGKRFLPAPREYLLLEWDAGSQGCIEAAGVPVAMYIDVVNYSEEFIDDDGEIRDDPGTVEVIDHKTTKDLKYAKTAVELRENIQMLMYGEYVRRRAWLELSSPLHRIRLSHNVFQTKPPGHAKKVSTVVSLDHVASAWSRVETIVERMKVTAGIERIEDVEANYASCNAFVECDYYAVCPRSTAAVFQTQGDSMSRLFDDFFAAPSPASAPAAPAPKPPASADAIAAARTAFLAEERATLAAQPVPIADPTLEALAAEKARRAAAKAEPNVTVTAREHGQAAVTSLTGDPKDYSVQVSPERARAVGVVPPDAPRSVPPHSAEAIPPTDLAGMHPFIQDVAKIFASEGNSVTVEGEGLGKKIIIEPAGDAELEVRAEKPKRGRPAGSKNKPAAAPPTVAERDAIGAALDAVGEKFVESAATLAEKSPDPKVRIAASKALAQFLERDAIGTSLAITESVSKETHDAARERIAELELQLSVAKNVPARKVGIELYVDTIVVDTLVEGAVPTSLEPYITGKLRALETHFQAADIRCAANDSALGFGRWKGVLAAAVRAEPPAPGAYLLVDVRESEIRQVVVEALRPLAAVYVRGR